MHPILFRIPLPDGGSIPIYTWGVMLGLSLVVGWFLTLGLAQRDGLPREMLANCYVITALAALLFSRLLFVLTNQDQFETFWSIFEIRSGGMVAYGGFLGGFVGSFAYLRWKRFPLIPWADVAVPSLASGLLLTRIGCYLYGCDFGTLLPEDASATLKKVGTFPHWPEGTLEHGDGSPAWAHHVDKEWIGLSADASLPVHPTQLYEAAVGAALLVFLLWARKRQAFRGQIFLYFTFLYGFARFCLEFLRDDAERGDVPPALPTHVLYSGSLALFAAAFAVWIAPIIKSKGLRVVASAIAFVPAVYAYVRTSPAAFASVPDVKLSTSQLIGLSSAVLGAWAFSLFHKNGLANPEAAMAPIPWEGDVEKEKKEEAEEAEETKQEKEGAGGAAEESQRAKRAGETADEAPAPKKRKKKKKGTSPA